MGTSPRVAGIAVASCRNLALALPYQLMPETVCAEAFGMMHDRTQGNLIFNTVFNNPAVVRTASVPAGNIVDLPGSPASFGNGVLGNILGAERRKFLPSTASVLASNTSWDATPLLTSLTSERKVGIWSCHMTPMPFPTALRSLARLRTQLC